MRKRVNVWRHSIYTTLTGIVADLAAFPATNEDTYSWVNGTITNLGEVAICSVAFASRDTDLTMALKLVPINLPTTTLDEALSDFVDLAPGEAIDFAYFLPFDDARNAPSFVGLANSLHACPEAKEKFVPELPELEEVAANATETVAGAADQVVAGAGDAVDATQETTAGVLDTVQNVAKKIVDGTQEKLDVAMASLQSEMKQPEEEAAAPADTTTTIPTTTEDKPVAEATGDAKAAGADAVKDAPKAAEPPVAELPTKEAHKEAETTSPAGTRSASGSVLLLGMIAALSVVALFA